jgi:NIPSNAP
MEARVQSELNTLFPRHGIRPLAGWSTIVSPVSPAFIYVTSWRNMNARSAAWAGFYSDPDWTEVRTRTNAGSELVESYEIMFLRAITPWAGEGEPPALSELIIQNSAIGKTLAVASEMKDHSLRILRDEGARVHGMFDMMSGRPLPTLASFIGWDSLDQRETALAKLDERANTQRDEGKPVLLDRAEQHLMKTVPVNWA